MYFQLQAHALLAPPVRPYESYARVFDKKVYIFERYQKGEKKKAVKEREISRRVAAGTAAATAAATATATAFLNGNATLVRRAAPAATVE